MNKTDILWEYLIITWMVVLLILAIYTAYAVSKVTVKMNETLQDYIVDREFAYRQGLSACLDNENLCECGESFDCEEIDEICKEEVFRLCTLLPKS